MPGFAEYAKTNGSDCRLTKGQVDVLRSLLLVAISIVSSVSGQVFLKVGMSQIGFLDSQHMAAPLQVFSRVLTNPMVIIGLACYGLGAAAWLLVLSRLDLSYAYPFLAANFVLITVASRVLLGETVPLMRWFGVAVICLGVLMVSRS